MVRPDFVSKNITVADQQIHYETSATFKNQSTRQKRNIGQFK